jgi:hypothetical protein
MQLLCLTAVILVEWYAGCGHLIVCSASQCLIYSSNNWNTPHIFDLKQPVQTVLQCGRCFALLDTSAGIQVWPAPADSAHCAYHIPTLHHVGAMNCMPWQPLSKHIICAV